MERPLISEATVARMQRGRERLFATSLLTGETEWLTLARNNEEDMSWTNVPPQQVVVRRDSASRRVQTQGTEFATNTGEFRKLYPFDVQRGDRFTLSSGAAGSITGAPWEKGGIVRATFTLET